jgi:hypothetical protein
MITELVKIAATVVPAIIEYSPKTGLTPANTPFATAPGTLTIAMTSPEIMSLISVLRGTFNRVRNTGSPFNQYFY